MTFIRLARLVHGVAIDDTDRKILRVLQQNARTSNSEIARQLGMVPSAILERIRKLETRGIIQGYEAKLDPKLMGVGLAAFINLRLTEKADSAALEAKLSKMPEVQEIHNVAGDDCYIIKVRVPDVEALKTLLYEKLPHDFISGTKTTIALSTVKEGGRVPVEQAGRPIEAPPMSNHRVSR